jgi:cell fate (sporulation/competence/biofilm development) regulator YlbF (YheA/YmcA/DUF963 family)
MTQVLEELDRIQRDTEQLRGLAQQYKVARNDREARRIRREMVKVSKDLNDARRAVEDIDGAEATAM